MKKILGVAGVLALIVILPFVSCDASAANDDNLWLYEIMPAGSFEAVTIYNGGSVSVNLKNYYLDDGEGTVKFTADLFLGPKEKITIASAAPEGWLTDRAIRIYGTSGIVAKSFILADAGDEIMLKRASNNQVLDSFVYGNGDAKIPGWNGEAFSKIPAGKMAARTSQFDTDTAKDWKLTVAGRTEEKINSAGMFDSVVTPFVFPDSKGDPVFRALENASKEVLISMYLLDHKEIVSLLIMLLGKGVSVNILVEGTPVGGVPDMEIRYLTALYEKGASVHMIKSNGVYKRYDLVHNKYAIIDSRTAVITSENWRESSFNGNRGWGAVIESSGYAGYMRSIFFADNDISRYDIHDLKEIYPSSASISVPQYKTKASPQYQTFPASVKAVLSPDISFEYLKREISNASDRIYAEQMTIQYAWTDTTTESPLSWSLTASEKGVDVKILADVTFADEDSGAKDNYTVVSLINDMGSIQARTIAGGDNFGLTHNKGVIIDDSVWISSVNWSNAAFLNNREVAAVIYSKDVADYFADFFMKDWGIETEVKINVEIKGSAAGEAIILDASSSKYPKGSTFEWEINNDGVIRKGVKIAATFPEGISNCVLIVTEPSGTKHVYEFTVEAHAADEKRFSFEPYIKYAPFIAISLAILVFAAVRVRRNDDT